MQTTLLKQPYQSPSAEVVRMQEDGMLCAVSASTEDITSSGGYIEWDFIS